MTSNSAASIHPESNDASGEPPQDITAMLLAQKLRNREKIKEHEQKLEKLGAFEVAFEMLKLAKNNDKQNVFLNAGRGNPNWVQTVSRLAFCRLMEFGVRESRRTFDKADIAGWTEGAGIAERLHDFLNPDDNKADRFLTDSLSYCTERFGFSADDFVKELVDGVIGNDYPVPSRVLRHTERIINAYLASALYHHTDGRKLAEETQLFPTEGGTAAICYIFNSLMKNGLIRHGDKIIINTPIFTPYINIPQLATYDLEEVDLRSTKENNWELSPQAIESLSADNVKALFLVNPSNPGSVALSKPALEAIRKTVEKNPDIIIITDDVYGPFTHEFESVYAVAPHNTLLVYSFSKLYGATGWRLGVIAMNKDNVFNRLIRTLPEDAKRLVDARYRRVVADPADMSFIDRMVADSRSIGLYHTSGLSTPQQIMEALFSLAHLLNEKKDGQDQDHYVKEAVRIVRERYNALHDNLGDKKFVSPENAEYYSIIDVYDLAEQYYGPKFAHWLRTSFERLDFLYKLSKRNGVVLMDGVGFGSAPGTLRVSEANLPNEAYVKIAHEIRDLMSAYHDRWLQETGKSGDGASMK